MLSFIKKAALAMAMITLSLSVMTTVSDALPVEDARLQILITHDINTERTAAGLGSLEWYRPLAYRAHVSSNEACPSSEDLHSLGMSTAKTVYSATNPFGDLTKEFTKDIQNWIVEKGGDYTNMMLLGATKLGCGFSTCTLEDGEEVGFFVCAYAIS